MENSSSKAYVCTITYGPPAAQPPNLATCSFSLADETSTPPLIKQRVNPGDTITFKFVPTAPAIGKPRLATLLAAFKTPVANADTSPFWNDANAIDILSFPTLTTGTRVGTWGITVLFTVETPAGPGTPGTSNFYFLPDPEIIVGPE